MWMTKASPGTSRTMWSRPKRVAWSAMGLLIAAGVMAQPLPEEGANAHLGPATCASSVCHGKVSPEEGANVLLNEYRTWSRDDYHSRAYTVLRNEESREIARKLGLSNAQTADICLDCHADNVPADKRGEKFQISDGVGCEACHGGAEQWIESHAEEGATHADNLARGMYPTEDPEARARLCLSCHLGTEGKFADHDIMAAGHPRMSFELGIFTDLQPAHYVVDEDYRERKGEIPKVEIWVKGMLYKAKREMALLRSELLDGHGMFPELAFFDCHACHHPMNDVRWRPSEVTRQLPIGVARVNDSSLQMLMAITAVLARDASATLGSQVAALHTASTRGKDAFVSQAGRLDGVLDDLESKFSERGYSDTEIRALRLELLQRAADGEYRDFTSAEQAYLGVETLCIQLDQFDAWQSLLDRWFATVEDEHDFDPGRFTAVASQLKDRAR